MERSDATLADAVGRLAGSVPTRAALHARPRPEVAREAYARQPSDGLISTTEFVAMAQHRVDNLTPSVPTTRRAGRYDCWVALALTAAFVAGWVHDRRSDALVVELRTATNARPLAKSLITPVATN